MDMSGRSRHLVNALAKKLRQTAIGVYQQFDTQPITETETGASFEVDLGNGRFAKVTVELSRVEEHENTDEVASDG